MHSKEYGIRAEDDVAFNLSPGHRFFPTDEELVNHYLKLKMLGYDQQVRHIVELNVCEFEPWELPNHSQLRSEDQVWYFFSPRSSQSLTSQRVNRTTRAGYWKVTGKGRKIRAEGSKEQIGVMKTLVFYQGRVPHGVKTSWTMQEYIPTFNLPNQKNFVICKIKRNSDGMPTTVEIGESSSRMPSSDHEESYNSYEEDAQMQIYLESFRGYNEKDYSLNCAIPFKSQNYQLGGKYIH